MKLNYKMNYFFLILCFLFSFALTIYLLDNTLPDKEPSFSRNLVLVLNTDICNNKCIHIHHWTWLLILFLLFITINYLLGYKWNKIYIYFISFYLGTFFGELVIFKSNIFLFQVPCFNNSKLSNI